MSTVPVPAGKLIYSAQYLRFLAASMVIIVHAYELVSKHGVGDIGQHFNLGAAGVDIFFVISGFIMCMITQTREKGTGAGEFLLHRLLRVAPPYWAVTALMALIVVVAPHLFDSTVLDYPHLASSFLFLGWPHPVMGDAMPIYFPGWTLNYEAFFYVIFAMFLSFPLKMRIVGIAVILLSLALIGLTLSTDNETVRFYTKPIMIEFIFGMIIAAFYLSGRIPGRTVCIAMIIIAVAMFVAGAFYWPVARLATERFIIWGLPAALLVGGAIFLEARGVSFKNSFLRLLGDASYAAYLTHFFIVGAVGVLWDYLKLTQQLGSDVFMIVFCFTLCWIVGVVYHLKFEKPLVAFLRRLAIPKHKAPLSP